jgi:hypothetical protein
MSFDRARSLDHRVQSAVSRPKVPFLLKARARFGRRLVVEVLERQPDLVGAGGLEMSRGQGIKCGLLPLRQRLRIAQPGS